MLDVIRIVVTGTAISSVWFWLFTLYAKSCEQKVFKLWLRIVVPQGILIAWAMFFAGIL